MQHPSNLVWENEKSKIEVNKNTILCCKAKASIDFSRDQVEPDEILMLVGQKRLMSIILSD